MTTSKTYCIIEYDGAVFRGKALRGPGGLLMATRADEIWRPGGAGFVDDNGDLPDGGQWAPYTGDAAKRAMFGNVLRFEDEAGNTIPDPGGTPWA